MTFIVGFDYSREEIHAQCGGSLHSELPHQKDRVAAACLDASRHPHAPCVILCGNRPDLCQAGALLAQQPAPIPVFIKNAARRWVYQGRFEVAQSFTEPADCIPYLAGSGRDLTTLSRVIVLRMI